MFSCTIWSDPQHIASILACQCWMLGSWGVSGWSMGGLCPVFGSHDVTLTSRQQSVEQQHQLLSTDVFITKTHSQPSHHLFKIDICPSTVNWEISSSSGVLTDDQLSWRWERLWGSSSSLRQTVQCLFLFFVYFHQVAALRGITKAHCDNNLSLCENLL